jgi:hypothetical protein
MPLITNSNIIAGATNYSYVGPSQYGGIMLPRGQILFSNTNSQNQFYLSSNARSIQVAFNEHSHGNRLY